MVVDDTAAHALPRAVDTVIIGAGCAGLALASRLSEQGVTRPVLVLDARRDYRDAQARIASSRSVTLRLGVTVGLVEELPQRARAAISDLSPRILVRTSAGTVAARHVIDTRPVSTRVTLFQCFVGVELVHGGALHAAPALVEPSTAGLMTRMRADETGFVFTYVLPLTSTTALVELTRFSPTPLPREHIARELDDELAALGVRGSVVVREESGVLPMGADPAADSPVPGVVRAGNAGGALRAATGYAFSRIQEWADACAAAMAAGDEPIPHPSEPWVQRQMDRIFLQTLRAHPERTP